MDQQTVLITGASMGIGKATAEAFVREGYRVLGTSRNPGRMSERDRIPGVEYLPLDLNDPASVEALLGKVGEVDILVNNAGQSQIGPVEEIPFDRIRALFETNLFGVMRLVQGVLPGMRKRRRGWIINLSSMAGLTAVPFSSIYAATKHALEGFSKGLRNEVKAFGIRVVTLEPGYIRTTIAQEKQLCAGSEYAATLECVKQIRDGHIAAGPLPEVVAEKILKIVRMKNPKPSYAVGGDAPLNALLIRFFPVRWVEGILRKKFKMDEKKPV